MSELPFPIEYFKANRQIITLDPKTEFEKVEMLYRFVIGVLENSEGLQYFKKGGCEIRLEIPELRQETFQYKIFSMGVQHVNATYTHESKTIAVNNICKHRADNLASTLAHEWFHYVVHQNRSFFGPLSRRQEEGLAELSVYIFWMTIYNNEKFANSAFKSDVEDYVQGYKWAKQCYNDSVEKFGRINKETFDKECG